MSLRSAICASIVLFALNMNFFSSREEEKTPTVFEIAVEQKQQDYHSTQLWRNTVKLVAIRTGISDLAYAERVALAIETATNEFDVDPWLIASLIRVESCGNPEAVSYAGAIGLTQILPETGEEIANKLGVPWAGQELLFDTETNVRFGVFYVKGLLDRFDGNIQAALAAYNWGPGHIANRLTAGEPLPVQYSGKILAVYAGH